MNLTKLFTETNRRLSDIRRFNVVPVIHGESVAEHCYFVSFYVMMLAKFIPDVDETKAIKMALIHDMEEVISGDFPHSTKTQYPKFTNSLEEMNHNIVLDIFQNDEEYINLWKESRSLSTEESRLITLCDKISVYLYTKDEMLLGNKHMEEIHYRQKDSLKWFIEEYPKYKFVEGIINL